MGGRVAIAVVVVAVGIRFGGEVTRALDADGSDPRGILGEAADLALEEVEDAEEYAENGDADQ